MRLAILASLLLASAVSAQPSVDEAFRELEAAQTPPMDERTLVRAVERMLAAVEADPDHPAALVAVSNAAYAMAFADRWPSAERLWQRVADEGTPRLAAEPRLVPVVAGALEQLARRAALRGDWLAAATAYRTLCDSPVFIRSTEPGMAERVERAFVGAAEALETLGAPRTAARYWLRGVERDPRDPTAPERLDHAAELFSAAGGWTEAKEASERLLQLYGRSRVHAELVARARARIARRGAPEVAGPVNPDAPAP